MSTIKEIIMEREDMSEDDADLLIADAKADLHLRLATERSVEDICDEWFGLEEDYLEQLI